MKYKAAIIGVGKAGGGGPKGGGHAIGYTHARMYQSNPARVDLIGAADINPENLSAFQNTFNVACVFASVFASRTRSNAPHKAVAVLIGPKLNRLTSTLGSPR